MILLLLKISVERYGKVNKLMIGWENIFVIPKLDKEQISRLYRVAEKQ